MKQLHKKIICLIFFAIAMGFLESAVVIYLRLLYYPKGFSFPLEVIPAQVGLVEVLREAATVIMLVTIGYLTGKNALQRFSYFILAFAVWDLFYYIFLYVFLGWPESLFTWDILFLIPVPWVGPVIAPCLLCLVMIIGAVVVISRSESEKGIEVPRYYWWISITGALVCILSFTWDYMMYKPAENDLSDSPFADLRGYIPQSFQWSIFIFGFLLMSFPLFHLLIKNKKENNSSSKKIHQNETR
jgi:hypothetical protein